MAKTKELTFGKIELTKNDNPSQYVPQNGGNFVDHGDILKTIAIGIKDNLPVLIVGESGTGKTSAIRYLAGKTNNGLRRVNLNGGTTADELVGRLLINDKGTYWVDGVLTEAMRNGDWLVLDEINAALPEVLFVLQSIMDDDGYLVLTEKDDKEIVHKNPNFRLFATCNPPEYAGTKEMNKALLSRFPVCISAEFPPAKVEMDIIEHHLGNAIAKSEIAEKLVGLAAETRKAKEYGTADYALNTRDILNALKLSQYMEPADALSLAFSNKLDKGDGNAIRLMAKMYLPNKKKTGALKAISSEKEIFIGRTYSLNSDRKEFYLSLTEEDSKFTKLQESDLGSIIGEGKFKNGIKGEEFVINSIYYTGESIGATKTEIMNEEKLASAITIIKGPNKGKKGIILHHNEVDAGETYKELSEVC